MQAVADSQIIIQNTFPLLEIQHVGQSGLFM